MLVRIIRHLNLRHGSDRVWSLERIRLGWWKGWDHKVVTPQFTFAWTWTDEVIDVSRRKAHEEYEKAAAAVVASGLPPPLPEAECAESGQMICSTPWGGNIGWPKLTDNAVMRIFQEKFFRQFSGQHPGWWADELPFFPFSASFSSAEDLEFQLEVNGI